MKYWLSVFGATVATAGVLLFPPQSAGEAAVDFVDEAGVTIIWTSDERNCGAQLGTGAGGCFRHETPGVVYVSPGMTDSVTEFIVYHEYAHSLGILDECEADRYAVEKGADKTLAPYLPNC